MKPTKSARNVIRKPNSREDERETEGMPSPPSSFATVVVATSLANVEEEEVKPENDEKSEDEEGVRVEDMEDIPRLKTRAKPLWRGDASQ